MLNDYWREMDTPTFESITLEKMNYTVSRRISRQEMNIANINLEGYMDHVSRDLVINLTAAIASKDLPGVKFPSDWKESFKERWFPEWLLKKYPVKYTEYTAKALYPDIAIPEHQVYVHIVKMDNI